MIAKLRDSLKRLWFRSGGKVNPLAVLERPEASAGLLGQALERALREGGYLTAERLAERLAPKIAGVPAHPGHRLLSDVQRVFRKPTAHTLDAGPGDMVPARHRAEHDLMQHNAAVAAGLPNLVALNRYLSNQGLPSCVRVKESGNWLDDVVFEAGAEVHERAMVSVIMSAHNAAGTVHYAIDSLLSQSYRNLEVLVCDDASTDGSWELLRERYAGNSMVRLFRSRENQGVYNARNALISLARGQYLTFHDADDVALPVRIERQVRCMSPSTVACASNWLRFRADGSVVFFWDQRALRLSIVSLMVRRDALLQVTPYPSARFGADLDVYRRLALTFGASAIKRLKEPLLFGLWSEQSLTRRPAAEALESGYRSPARRAYSELVFQRDLLGDSKEWTAALESMLRVTGNCVPTSILEAHD